MGLIEKTSAGAASDEKNTDNEDAGRIAEVKRNFSYEIKVADYYNDGFILSGTVKRFGFSKAEEWTEMTLFPMLNFEMTVYKNRKLDSKKKNATEKHEID